MEPTGDIPVPTTPEISIVFQDESVQVPLVQKLLEGLEPNKAMGPDGVHPRVLRELCDVLAKPLTIIFNSSLRTGSIPPSWREAHVSAIFKKGSKKHTQQLQTRKSHLRGVQGTGEDYQGPGTPSSNSELCLVNSSVWVSTRECVKHATRYKLRYAT